MRRLSPEEVERKAMEIEKKADNKKIVPDQLDFLKSNTVADLLRIGHYPPEGLPILGEAFLAAPEDQNMVLDFTTPMGACSNAYWAFVFQLPKWGYTIKKVDEWMDVSPVHADSYNLLVSQRQKIESAIKTGLSSAAESITHYELLAHDARRYREIIDYFKQGQKDEHVLRSLFVDRVDAYTGEGYSLITMTKRWPTIITDFIRMDTELNDIKKIMRELDVSQAEATVLKTKNELYIEWKRLFRPVVMERYARIKTMVDARKKSIDEYKRWLKPYVTRHKMMEEMPERKASMFRSNPVMVPGFGQAVMFSGVRLWIWRPFNPTEPGKPESMIEKRKSGEWEIEPYDDFVKRWVPYIEYKYKVEITAKEIKSLLKEWTTERTEKPRREMDPARPYYIFFDVAVNRSIIKTAPPEGSELENIMLDPLRTMVMSQNILLVHLLELAAIENNFDHEIDELIGAPEFEEEELRRVRAEFEEKKKEKKKKSRIGGKGVKRRMKPFARYVMRPGPYESTFKERVTKIYLVGSGPLYGQMVTFWKNVMGVK